MGFLAKRRITRDIPAQQARWQTSRPLYVVGATLLVTGVVAAAQGVDTPSTPKPVTNASVQDLKDEQAQKPKLDKDSEAAGDQSSQTVESSTTTTQSTSLEVNGQNIDVPANGEIHRTIDDENGHTSIDVTNETHGSSTSSNIEVFSSSGSGGDN